MEQRKDHKKLMQNGRGNLARNILSLIRAHPGSAVAANTVQLIASFEPQTREERTKIWKTIKYLESKNRVRIIIEGKDRYAIITESGKRYLSARQIEELDIKKPARWDYKWRFVMFDLPVRCSSTARHSFRAKLEDMGFKLYQRSVFIYPYECHEEVHTIAKWYGLDAYIRYIVATEVHDMRKFIKAFDLPGYDQ